MNVSPIAVAPPAGKELAPPRAEGKEVFKVATTESADEAPPNDDAAEASDAASDTPDEQPLAAMPVNVYPWLLTPPPPTPVALPTPPVASPVARASSGVEVSKTSDIQKVMPSRRSDISTLINASAAPVSPPTPAPVSASAPKPAELAPLASPAPNSLTASSATPTPSKPAAPAPPSAAVATNAAEPPRAPDHPAPDPATATNAAANAAASKVISPSSPGARVASPRATTLTAKATAARSPTDAAVAKTAASATAGAPPATPLGPVLPTNAAATKSANTLTSASAMTPTPQERAADPMRERLQGAQTASIHQRTLQGAAHGEIDLPGLGRVAVSARVDRDAVDVDVRAAQVSTAQALHARADDLAAEVRAGDLHVSRMSFEGAGTWTPSDTASSQERDGDPARTPRDEARAALSPQAGRAPVGRVRIVL